MRGRNSNQRCSFMSESQALHYMQEEHFQGHKANFGTSTPAPKLGFHLQQAICFTNIVLQRNICIKL